MRRRPSFKCRCSSSSSRLSDTPGGRLRAPRRAARESATRRRAARRTRRSGDRSMCSPTARPSVGVARTSASVKDCRRKRLTTQSYSELGLPRQSFWPQPSSGLASLPGGPPRVTRSPPPPAASRGSPTSPSGAAARWSPSGSSGWSPRSRRAGLAGDWSADYSTPGSESRAAADAARRSASRRAAPTPSTSSGRRPTAPARLRSRERIDRLAARADGLEGIGRGAAPRPTPSVSRDGTIGVLRIPLTELPGAIPDATGETLIDLAERGERRRAARRARRPADRQRAGGRDLVGDGRPRDRGARAAAHVRVGRGGRAPARHGAVRPRHLERADRAAGGGDGRPRLGAGARLDARHRRRDRLRAADRHALSRRARRAGRAPRAAVARVGRHRRAARC